MKKPKFTQAFTLIELITVMVILMIVAGLVVGVGSSARRKAMETKADSMIAALEVALSMYHADFANYPTDEGGGGYDDTSNLVDLLSNREHATGGTEEIAGWQGPYMEFKSSDLDDDGNNIIDPWGRNYRYQVGPTGTHNYNFDIWSLGADGQDNTGDEVTNW